MVTIASKPSRARVVTVWTASLVLAFMTFAASGIEVVRQAPQSLSVNAGQLAINRAQAAAGLAANRERLAREPLDAGAIRDVALVVGAPADAARGLRLAERVTRREPWTQLLLIEHGARAGDMAATLRHYDVLLSTSSELTPLLVAQLAKAIAVPQVRSGLKPYAARPWMGSIVYEAASRSGGAADALALARELDLVNGSLPDAPASVLLTGLVNAGEGAQAIATAYALAGGKLDNWQDIGFAVESTSPRLRPLTWELAGSGDLEANLAPEGGLEVTDATSTDGVIAERVLALGPGHYAVRLGLAGDGSGGRQLQWNISCRGPASTAPQGVTRDFIGQALVTQFSVGRECGLVDLRLILRGDDAQGSRTFSIGPVVLSRVGA